MLLRKEKNGRQASIPKSVATTSSPVGSCKSGSFLRLLFGYSAGKPVRGPFHPDYVPSVFSHAIQVAKAPSSRYIRAVKRSAKRSLHESSGTRKRGMAYQPPSSESDEQEANKEVESYADYGGLRQYEEAERDASIGELNEHKNVEAYSKQQYSFTLQMTR